MEDKPNLSNMSSTPPAQSETGERVEMLLDRMGRFNTECRHTIALEKGLYDGSKYQGVQNKLVQQLEQFSADLALIRGPVLEANARQTPEDDPVEVKVDDLDSLAELMKSRQARLEETLNAVSRAKDFIDDSETTRATPKMPLHSRLAETVRIYGGLSEDLHKLADSLAREHGIARDNDIPL
jgi:hypothetical protein